MAKKRRPIALIDGVHKALPASDVVAGAGDVWVGTAQYQQGEIRRYWFTGTTDANGRMTCYPTTTGTATGAALFSGLPGFSATPRGSTTDPTTVAYCYLESVSADFKTVVVRAVTGRNMPILLLGTYASTQFAPAGITVSVMLVGLPA